MATTVLMRALSLFAFWLVVSGLKPLDMAAGAITAGVAAWISVRLMPPGELSVRPLGLALYAMRMLRQSVVAGFDVAWRALDPRLPLRPGFVHYQSRLAPGIARSAFCTTTSLLPGTLPCGTEPDGAVVVHCLDVTQPVTTQLAAEEASFVRALGGEGHG
jgi:multicomponent Na+:H+ antiporter subunit E